MRKRKKYEVLIAVQQAGNSQNELATISEIKKFYDNVDDSYLISLTHEGLITYGFKDQEKAYRLLPNGEDYICLYDDSSSGRKIAVSTLVISSIALCISLIACILQLLEWLMR